MAHYCFFAANFLPNLGGVERYTRNLSLELISRGNKVTVVTSNVFSLPEQEEMEGIKIIRLPCINLLKGRFPIPRPNHRWMELLKLLKTIKFDFIIIQTRFYLHSLIGAQLMKKTNVPGIVIEHGSNHFTVNNSFLDFFGAIYEHVISSLVKRRCPYIFGVSEECCKWSEHFDFAPKGILYNAVNLQEIQHYMNNPCEDYRKQLQIPSDSVVIAYTGRLVLEKGINKLVDAISTLRTEKNMPLELVVAGDGDLFQELKEKNYPYVHMLGKIEFPQVIALLKESDIFCLPTDYPEGFPTSVLEAVACHCYVITTENGGSKELILDDSYGAILKNNDVRYIANAIYCAATDAEYRHNAERKSYERLCDHFTWNRIADNVINIKGEMVDD